MYNVSRAELRTRCRIAKINGVHVCTDDDKRCRGVLSWNLCNYGTLLPRVSKRQHADGWVTCSYLDECQELVKSSNKEFR
jgi:hypothetical protein